MTLMTISQKGIDAIKQYESCKLFAYRDSVGVPTIGYGHTKGVKMGMSITQKQAEDFLKDDIKPCERVLNAMGINYTQNQFDALVSWIFNLGEGKFSSSTMRKRIIERANDIDITDQMVRWYNAGGKPSPGLKRRRVKEANMFLGKDVYYIDSSNNIKKKGL